MAIRRTVTLTSAPVEIKQATKNKTTRPTIEHAVKCHRGRTREKGKLTHVANFVGNSKSYNEKSRFFYIWKAVSVQGINAFKPGLGRNPTVWNKLDL